MHVLCELTGTVLPFWDRYILQLCYREQIMLRLLNFAAKVVAPGVSHVTAMTKVIVWGRCEEVRDHGSRILHDSGRNHVHR